MNDTLLMVKMILENTIVEIRIDSIDDGEILIVNIVTSVNSHGIVS